MQIKRNTQSNTYIIAIKGTTTCDTLEIRLIPPINTSATHALRTSDAITTVHEYVPIAGIFTVHELSGSKNPIIAEEIPFT